MINYNLAIKLGSCNTVIYKTGQGIVLKEPSLIAIHKNGKKEAVEGVGTIAKQMYGKTNGTIEIINPIYEGQIADFDACKLMLNKFLERVSPSGLFKQKNKVVFIIPCGLTAEEKNKFTLLAYSLNINNVALITTSVCGLIGMGVEENDIHSHMIINMGGGVTDIAIINNNHIIRGATINIGGSGIDYNIQNEILECYDVKCELPTCELIKNNIGSLLKNDISNYSVIGFENITKQRKKIKIYSSDIYPVLTKAFNRIIESAETIINMCSGEVLQDINNYGIYVCGGLSNITGIEKYFTQKLKLPVFVDVDADISVIMGAGKLLNNPKLLNLLIKK